MPSVLCFLTMAGLFLLLGGSRACASEPRPEYDVEVVVKQQEGKVVEGNVRSHTLRVDQPRNFAGTDVAPTPPEIYAFSVGACLVSAMRFVGELEGLPVNNIQATVHGRLDFSKAMGVDMSQRAGFPLLGIAVTFDAPWDVAEKKRFVARVMERCPICDNTANATPLEIDVRP